MLKATAKERNENITIFQDMETGEFYKYYYVTPTTHKPSLFCRKGHEVTEEELRMYGCLIKQPASKSLNQLILNK